MEYYGCSDLGQLHLSVGGRLDFPFDHERNQKILSLCCNRSAPGMPFAKTAEETLERFLGMRDRLIIRGGVASSSYENVPCAKCYEYRKGDWGFSLQINKVTFAPYPSPCQCRCSYCRVREDLPLGWEKNPIVVEGYGKIFDFLNLVKSEKIISPDARWFIAGGEITIHPYKKHIMRLAKGSPTFFFTNGFIFDEDMAQEMHENPQALLNISIDCGTAETWHKVKGLNNFPKVIENLKRYSQAAISPRQIVGKYIILPGINDSDEDFLSFIELEKSLNFSLGTFSRDNNTVPEIELPSKIPLSSKIFNYDLIDSAARFAALHLKIIGHVSFSNFTEEEKRQTLNLAEKLLPYL